MSGAPPKFVVVGGVNQGKSSIVAALVEDESVPIDAEWPTTREAKEYPYPVDTVVQFTLIDTPGFQDAAAALAQIRRLRRDASLSEAAVRSFVDTYRNLPEFADETRLLAPILDGGRILYVVDGTRPYSPDCEAEMEILRWTGRPRMALVNRIGPGDHIAEWKQALGQYFNVVRDFDANRAGFDDRIRLLESFRELDEEVRPVLDRSIQALRDEQRSRRREVARVITSLVVDALTRRVDLDLRPDEEEKGRREEARLRIEELLREAERKAHGEIFATYRFRRQTSSDLSFPKLEEDLFSEKTWKIWGLTHRQFLLAGALGGAAAGLAIDAIAHGHTLGGVALGGGLIGLVAAAMGSGKKLGSVGNVLKHLKGEVRVARFGPLGAPVAWVVLDRALDYSRAIAARSHSVQEEFRIAGNESILRKLPATSHAKIGKLFARIAKQTPPVPDDLRAKLREWIEKLMEGPGSA